jgi:hypothetical protein
LQSYHVKPKTDKSEAPLVAEWACNVAKGADGISIECFFRSG